jgi:hypothetical protein
MLEQNCTIEHEGKTYEAGGSYLLPCTDGKVRGIVYVDTQNRTVTTWHGELIARLDALTYYRGNFCRMARISFTHEGRKFIGDYCPNWADACKVRSTK